MSTTTPPDAGANASATISADPGAAPSTSPLPPLTGREFREYNRLAEHMDAFHAHFRTTWNLLYTSASSGRRAQGLSIRAFINTGLDFISHLETHHAIEERYVFPDLARRMPEFRTGREREHNLPTPNTDIDTSKEDKDPADDCEGKKKQEKKRSQAVAAELLQQHVEIHKGMEGLREYLRKCLSGETELQMSVLKTQLDTWGTVLWTHLDQEVRTLGAENMRRYWTLDEMRKVRM